MKSSRIPIGKKPILTRYVQAARNAPTPSTSTVKIKPTGTPQISPQAPVVRPRPQEGNADGRREKRPITHAEKTKKLKLLTFVKIFLGRLRGTSHPAHSLLQSWRKSFKNDITWLENNNAHYKHPVERLAKRIKKDRIENIPPDINIHRHRHKGLSFVASRPVRQQTELICKVFQRHAKKIQPKVGWDYNKHQKRLLLGFRHRKLSKNWRYFQPFKNLFRRHIKPNNHLPDAVFFVFNIIILISCGFYVGVTTGVEDYLLIVEDLIDYSAFKLDGLDVNNHNAYRRLRTWTSLHANSHILFWSTIIMCLAVFIGLVGIYVADQRFHLAYFIGMVVTLILEVAVTISSMKASCPELTQRFRKLLDVVANDYYDTIDAHDIHGNPVMWRENSSGPEQILKIRTYKAANIMDAIQQNLLCCGGTKNIENYVPDKPIPSSCCSPLWNQNPYCARDIPEDEMERTAKLMFSGQGCADVMERLCYNGQRMMGPSGLVLCVLQTILAIAGCWGLILQARQIRQLRRPPHMRISAGSISQSLQASAGTDGSLKAGGVRVGNEANQLNDKQLDHLQQLRRDVGLKQLEDEEQSSSSSNSSGELPVHTVNFSALKNLQDFVDLEDKRNEEKILLDKTVEQFAGRFNIVANKNLENYVSGIFSTTYQNETNAGLEAISRSLERQFAQHTTDYDWRKLLTKPKKVNKDQTVPKGKSTSDMALPKKRENGEKFNNK